MLSDQNLCLLDVGFIERHFGGDALFLQLIVQSYQKTWKATLVELRESFRSGNKAAFANSIHKLKGSTVNFGQGDFVDKLNEIEHAARDKGEFIVDDREIELIEQQLVQLTARLSDLVKEWSSPPYAGAL